MSRVPVWLVFCDGLLCKVIVFNASREYYHYSCCLPAQSFRETKLCLALNWVRKFYPQRPQFKEPSIQSRWECATHVCWFVSSAESCL
jgi:hypothetical protein